MDKKEQKNDNKKEIITENYNKYLLLYYIQEYMLIYYQKNFSINVKLVKQLEFIYIYIVKKS